MCQALRTLEVGAAAEGLGVSVQGVGLRKSAQPSGLFFPLLLSNSSSSPPTHRPFAFPPSLLVFFETCLLPSCSSPLRCLSLLQVLARFANATLVMTFESWRDHAHEERLLRRISAQFLGSCLLLAFVTWRDHTKELREERAQAQDKAAVAGEEADSWIIQ